MITTLLFILHILSGALCLIAAIAVIALEKGDRRHRQLGLVFLYSMCASAASALILALVRPNYFLFVVGIFSLYLVLSGKRALRLRTRPYNSYDVALSATMCAFGLLFLGWGALLLWYQKSFGAVLLAFGAIGTLLSLGDLRFYRKGNPDRHYLLKSHFTKMMGGAIAAFTAFLVVNNTWLPGVIAWLFPTAAGTALIVYWRSRYS